MPPGMSGVLLVLMMSGKKLSELRFVFILYSQDTFATSLWICALFGDWSSKFCTFYIPKWKQNNEIIPNPKVFEGSIDG